MGLNLSILVFIGTFMSKVRCISTNTPTPPLYSSVVRSHFSSPPEYQSCTIGWLVPMISLGEGGLVSFHPLESSWHSVVCLWERMAELSSLSNPSLGCSLRNVLSLGLEPQPRKFRLGNWHWAFNWKWLEQGRFSGVSSHSELLKAVWITCLSIKSQCFCLDAQSLSQNKRGY